MYHNATLVVSYFTANNYIIQQTVMKHQGLL